MVRGFILTVLLCAGCAGAPALAPIPGDPFAAEIAAFARADEARPPAPCQTLFVGSSSIRLWSTLAEDMAPHAVINRGFGGSTIADVNRYFGEVVAPHRPRTIVFYAGENEIDRGAEPDEVVASFADFMRLKRRALGETPVYFISLKPSRARATQMDRQRAVNEAITAMAARERDLVFIDVAQAMLENGAPADIYVEDGLHMSAQGYTIWTRLVNEALAQPAAARAPGC